MQLTQLSFAAVVIASLLVGCATTPEPAPSIPATEPAELSPVATPEPSALAALPEVSDLILSEHGVGTIVVGEPYDAMDVASDILVWDDTFCGYADQGSDTADFGAWQSPYIENGYPSYLVHTDRDRGTPQTPIRWIELRTESIRTADGIGMGSTLPAVTAAYGDKAVAYPSDGGLTPYVIVGGTSQLVLWFVDDDAARGVAMIFVTSTLGAPQRPLTDSSGCN